MTSSLIIVSLTLLVLVLLLLFWAIKHHKKPKTVDKSQPTATQPTAAPAGPPPVTESKAPLNSSDLVKPRIEEVPAPAVTEPAAPVAAQPTPAADSKASADSTLYRHFLATEQAEKQTNSNPYPTDSVLRRHYETLHKDAVAQAAPQAVAPIPVKPRLPEDSVLKRHFLAQLTQQIEAELAPSPTDSILKRHHGALVQAALQQYLSDRYSA